MTKKNKSPRVTSLPTALTYRTKLQDLLPRADQAIVHAARLWRVLLRTNNTSGEGIRFVAAQDVLITLIDARQVLEDELNRVSRHDH
jgi:hypothetical protein